MEFILKIPFAAKDDAKQIAKDSHCALFFEPNSKNWILKCEHIPDLLKQYIVNQQNIEVSQKILKSEKKIVNINQNKSLKNNFDNISNQIYTFFFDFPFERRNEFNSLGLSYNSTFKSYFKKTTYDEIYNNKELVYFLSQPFSYESWLEFYVNGKYRPMYENYPDKDIWEIRSHQEIAAKLAYDAYRKKLSGFLIADQVGLGKTISSLETVRKINNIKQIKTLLVVTTLAATAHWKNTFLKFNMNNIQILIINYDKLQKLFKPNETSYKKEAKTKRAKNKRISNHGIAPQFDICIFDESHKMKNMTSMRAKLGRKISDKTLFNLYLSATAGQNPLELSYLIPMLASVTGQRISEMEDFEKWCLSMELGVKRVEFGKWIWERSEDSLNRVHNLLFNSEKTAGIRRLPQDIVGWPPISREMEMIELTPEQIPLYKTSWDEFKRLKHEEYNLKNIKTNTKQTKTNQLVANLRLRQKTSFLKIDYTFEKILEHLDNNMQVAVSIGFKDSMQEFINKLDKEKITYSTIHGGQNSQEKEINRLKFQHGENKVILFTVEEAISLHQGEHNNIPRVLLIHDLRWSAISMTQIEGRTHRDGKFSQAYWMYIKNTIEEDIAKVVLDKMIGMNSMVGDDVSTLKEIENLLYTKIYN